jgi:ATP-dependent HslUV protease ATP-binding subunit HslU
MSAVDAFTPREVVSELDRYIVGQGEAKRAVAIALRNRWRRQQVPEELRDEIAPKNIIMIGPTGVGKTEIARRLAKMAQAPFIKVEASKFTEVGYVGRDVESIIRDLIELGISMVLEEKKRSVRVKAEERAEDRLLDALLPMPESPPYPGQPGSGHPAGAPFGGVPDASQNHGSMDEPHSTSSAQSSGTRGETREKLRTQLRRGLLDDGEVELELDDSGTNPTLSIFTPQGVEEMGVQFKDLLGGLLPQKTRRRKLKVPAALQILIAEEATRLVDMDNVRELAVERVEQSSIVFIDEIDKVAVGANSHHGGEVSREGVQRDLLPIVEGSTVQTKHGPVRTDHILFIAAGAFHSAKPSDLIPELQGRFPIRVELSSLTQGDFVKILTEPQNSLARQYVELLQTESVNLEFKEDAILAIAEFAAKVNERADDIGARRLHTLMEKLLEDVSFDAPDMGGSNIVVDESFVRAHLQDLVEDEDLSRFIL